jgi:hypothetical protein
MPSPTCFSLSSQFVMGMRKRASKDPTDAPTIPGSRVDVSVAIPECGLDSMLDLACWGLPGSCMV